MGYKVIKVDGRIRSTWCGSKAGFTKYGKPYVFKTIKEAEQFIERRSYDGMSWKYEIIKWQA